ncbi:exopolysaccharide biosynthesis polyprenyl glycosylphosphotransferase [Enhydrobacter sp.]|jgi:exopolysaccharide biosynthesis polyprenyl glycosylphosphotransferase|uniref:exopolysaccharide biosynthesis polyprenyl glycosylphosphotransferase n=1 Tax=Enhydrobacter sp. TaxID=1894999 RepID=UPI0026233EB5|nr:exopolysaccharide biosynthesis polyprenyl glycosylphosphotransferase [Enhydrobacter sp.]WIM12340.1 MAG: UDP-galactose-lipid carrier transferase [Enhydrobacter sp.]
MVSGAIAITIAFSAAVAIWPTSHVDFADWLLSEMSALLPLLAGISAILGVYRPTTKSLMERFRNRASATLIFMLAAVVMCAREDPSLVLVVVPLIGAFTLVLGSWAEHLIVVRFARSGAWGMPTAILGAGARGQAFARLLLDQPAWGLRPVGFIDDGMSDAAAERAPGGEEGDTAGALPRLGTIDEWGVGAGIEVVVVPDGHDLPPDPDALYRLGVRKILVVSQLGDLASFGLQVRHFDRYVALELGGRPSSLGRVQKRAIDLALALPLAVLTWPMVACLALMIKVVDPGSAFYRQQRVGRDGKPIYVLKLRTMYRDAEQRLEQVLATDEALREQWQRYFKLTKDPRILPHIGDFLRRTSLDELPQLWNVIRGDMSLVGPRPFPAYHIDAFDREFQALRATVTPGLTGLWQISARSSGDLGVQRAQDCFYIRNRSLWLDLYILIATLPAVIVGHGAK